MKSRAIVFTGKQKAEVQEIDVAAPGPGEILVRTQVSLISTGTECICYRAESDEGSHWHGWVKHPFYPGYSNVSQVEAIGVGVDGVRVGDRIFATVSHCEHHLLPADSPFSIVPDGISNEEAAWSKLATIAQTGVRRAEIRLGDTAVVIGLGPLGQLVTQYLRLSGVEELLVIDPVQGRLDIASKHGATQVFCGSAGDAVSFVESYTGGQLADVVFDVTGHYAVFPLALKLVRRFGTMMLVGDSPHPSKQHLEADLITKQLQIRGSHNENLPGDQSKWNRVRQAQLLYRYLQRGQMDLSDMISAVHKPEDADVVYAGLLTDRSATMGVIFDWSAS